MALGRDGDRRRARWRGHGPGTGRQRLQLVRLHRRVDHLEDFTKETGIKVVYDVFDSNEILETKLLAGGSGYDIVVPTSNFLARQIEAGVYQKLDKSKLPNLSNMWDVVTERMAKFDPGNAYSINCMWGTVGIGYNEKKVAEALGIDKIDSWDVFFNPEKLAKLAECGVYVLDSPSDIIPTTLQLSGSRSRRARRPRTWPRPRRRC